MAAFKKDDLIEMLDGDCETLEKVEDSITGTSRWSIQYEVIFKEKESGKFYAANYSAGATEQQDESPFEYEPESVECAEVRPVERTVIAYER